MLGQRPQCVGLILGRILSARQDVPLARGIVPNLRIMTRRDEIGSQCGCLPDEFLPLDCPVANDSGVGSPTMEVFIDKIVDDVPPKLLREIQHVVWKPELRRYHPCVIDPVERTAAALTPDVAAYVFVVVRLHRQADKVVALLGEQ